jgi:hypothetical protein
MKKNLLKLFLTAGLMTNLAPLAAWDDFDDWYPIQGTAWNVIEDIPVIEKIDPNFECIPNVAQYKQGDWSQVVGRTNNISLWEAKRIAKSDPKITYFFYVKGYTMVLETNDRDARVFHHGDAVFFAGTPHWGTAPGLADGYVKK